ncbi:unnamed protein product [Arctia plantaginis]|uniref:BED-type domain-containing protein n=1 Tax=Arctia plantaginis TaxID=874455 RepID=A0A8S0ZP72_ARCPL|nr:unnamed protein product [Arctia plantaginis]
MPRREANPYWDHFDKKDETMGICKYCSQCISYKSTTGNLRSHLKKKHPYILANDIIITPPVPPSQQMLPQPPQEIETTEAIVQFTTTSSTTATAELPSSFHSSITASTSGTCNVPARRRRQRTINSYIPKPITQEMKKKIDRDLLDLFIDDMQPFSMVNDKGFQKLLSWIPGYTPPSRKTISNSLIPALFEKTWNECREILDTETVTACITTDCWTSNNNDSFVAVTAHYISPKFKFKSILLDCKGCPGSHTSELLAQQIKGIVLKWNLLDKVNFAVSDNAHNICNAITNKLRWKHYGCFAHSLNLIVKEALIPIQVTIEKVKKIVAHFKRSTQANEKLMKYQSNHLGIEQPKKLVMEVVTRWNSTYLMIKRFIELREAVKATTAVINKEWPIMSQEEWTNLELLVSVLAPFEEITSSLSGQNYVTGGLAIVLCNSLRDICQEMLQNRHYIDAEIVQNVLIKLKSGLDSRFQNIEQSKTLALCTLLDPRFKLEMFKSDTNKNSIKEYCHEKMADILSRQVPTTIQVAPTATVSGSSVWNKVDSQLSKTRGSGTPLSKAIREMRTIFDFILLKLKLKELHLQLQLKLQVE